MKVICLVLSFMLVAGNSFAETPINPVDSVFARLDDLMIRVESGISLNSYAESLAELKISHRNAEKSNFYGNNPLLSDRLKPVLKALDDYAAVWSLYANDGEKNTVQISNELLERYKVQGCLQRTNKERYSERNSFSYSVPCVKSFIFEYITSKLASARSAHENGW